MINVARERHYLCEEEPDNILPRTSHNKITSVDESNIGAIQLIKDVLYYVKGVTYRMENPGQLIKIVIVE